MGKSALCNTLVVAALLAWLPARAQELKTLSKSDLLSPSTGPSQGSKIAGYLCDGRLLMSPVAVAANFVGEVVAEGRSGATKIIIHLIGHGAETLLCDRLVVKSPTPEPDIRKSNNVATMPRLAILPNQPIAGPKPLAQQPCSPGQLYDVKEQVCVELEVTPNCPPGQFYVSGQCTDVAALTLPRCADYEDFDIIANKCVIPKCPRPLIFNPLEEKCVSQITFGGVSCRASQLEYYGTCIPMPLR